MLDCTLIFSCACNVRNTFFTMCQDVFYEKNKKSDEELEKILTDKDSRYRETVNTSRERRAEFQTFFNKLKDGSDPDAERRMKEALHGGKGDQKRLYSVDKTLYGTDEGVAEKQRASEELKQKEDERMRRKKKKKKVTPLSLDKESPSADKKDPRGSSTTSSSISTEENLGTSDRNRIWTAMAAGSAVAFTVALILGGRPRSS